MARLIDKTLRKLTNSRRKVSRPFKAHNRIEISKSALIHNYNLVSRITGLDVMPVLKANAYGHGIEEIASILAPIKPKYLVVDGYFEARKIWAVVKQPVLVMGAIEPGNFKYIPHKLVAFFVQDKETVKAMGETGRPFVLHLECDTGMSRYGVSKHEIAEVLETIKTYPKLVLEGVSTHFADADAWQSNFLDEQLKRFDWFLDKVNNAGFKPPIIHAANTAGSQRADSARLTAIRPGIAIYGLNSLLIGPDANKYKDLRPVMRIISTIAKTRTLEKGDSVSYGRTFVAEKRMTIGVLPMGYYEAVPRELSGKGVVSLGEHLLPILGRVCMNHTIISLEETGAKIGDEVVVLDNDSTRANSFRGWHRDYGLYAHQTMTGVNDHVRRVIVD